MAALALMAVSVASVARADLTPWKDYQVSDAVWQVTTVKVDAGMGDAYLEGLKKTWLTSMETQKKLGNIEDYKIFRSDLFMSGEFNMMLVVKFKNTADMAPNKAKYEAFVKEWGEARQKEAKDLFERLARSQADFENYKKRQQRERDEAIKFGNEKLLKELLPVLDNLLRALSVAPPDDGAHSLMSGVKLVAKQFEDALGKFGVQGFASQGLPFDPAKHEAVGARPDANVPAQHVLEEFQRGYLLQDRLLRPALVIVSSGPAEGGN